MRTLFAKIFLWFWLAMIVLAIASVLIALFLTGTPLVRQWASNFTDFYAQNAVHTYLAEGTPALENYLNGLRQSREVDSIVFGPDGERIAGPPLTPMQSRLATEARASGQTECRIAIAWNCATVVQSPRGRFTVIARITRPRRVLRGVPFSAAFTRGSILIIAAGLLCLALARYIVRPVVVLQTAVRQLAAGDLSARAAPQLAPRKDELVSLAADFDLMAERIESLMRSQRQMLGDISHELRSPLTRLRVALELSEDGEPDTLQRMDKEIRRLDELIEQILTLNRLDAGEKWIELQSTNLGTILAEIVRDANYEGRARSVTVDLKTPPVVLQANPALLKSCIENIVRNALRYSPENSRVEVDVHRNHDVVIAVRDRGPGVPEELLPRLFEPFFRVSESRSDTSGGRGLGLSIAQRAAAVHGGSVTAHNLTGGGLEMEVRLPATGPVRS